MVWIAVNSIFMYGFNSAVLQYKSVRFSVKFSFEIWTVWDLVWDLVLQIEN